MNVEYYVWKVWCAVQLKHGFLRKHIYDHTKELAKHIERANVNRTTMVTQAQDTARIEYAPKHSAFTSSTFLGFRFTFAQGFLAGQLSVVIIALLAIRYMIFEDSKISQKRSRRPSHIPIRITKNRKGQGGNLIRSSSTIKDLSSLSATGRRHNETGGGEVNVQQIMTDILEKVNYEVDSHASESIDWINILIAQALAGYRQDLMSGGWSADHVDSNKQKDDPVGEKQDPMNDENVSESIHLQRTARDWMEEILNFNTIGRGMTFLDPIQVTHVEFGDAYPIFSNVKVRPADDMGRMRIELDIDYSDCMSLAIETKLLINFPKPRFAVLPISLGLTIERFSGTLAVELFSNSSSKKIPLSIPKVVPESNSSTSKSRHELHFSLHPDFTLDATASSLVGSRAKLQDLPKIEQLLIGRVRTYIHDRIVWPEYWSLTLPNLIPRHVRNRKGEEERLPNESQQSDLVHSSSSTR